VRLLAAASAVAERVWGYASEGRTVYGVLGETSRWYSGGVSERSCWWTLYGKKSAIIGIINIIIISIIIN